MEYLKVNKAYIDMIKSDEETYFKDYLETLDEVANSTAQYKGMPVPFLYHPIFFTKEDIENFEKIGKMVISITNKVTNRYLTDEKFRKKFGFPKAMEELILVDPGYDINVPMGRFDIFYENYDNFKFCELNTDGSSAMNEDNTVARILLGRKALKDFSKDYDLKYFELIDTWVDESLSLYRKHNRDLEFPNVAILDFKESATGEEFKLFKKAYEDKGCKTIIADLRDLEYRDGKLYHENFRIDMVYRRVVTFELVDQISQVQDFVEAYKNRAMFTIGSIRSQVVHNKVIFKILHDENTLEFLDEEEQNFIKKHIPHTFEFKGSEEVFEMVLNNKDGYIMKPYDLNASKGVFAGKDLSQDEWKEKLTSSFNKEYIGQEFVESYDRDFIEFRDGHASVEPFKGVVGIFMYNEEFKGLYTRIGQGNIIAGLTDYRTVPNILVRKKDDK